LYLLHSIYREERVDTKMLSLNVQQQNETNKVRK